MITTAQGVLLNPANDLGGAQNDDATDLRQLANDVLSANTPEEGAVVAKELETILFKLKPEDPKKDIVQRMLSGTRFNFDPNKQTMGAVDAKQEARTLLLMLGDENTTKTSCFNLHKFRLAEAKAKAEGKAEGKIQGHGWTKPQKEKSRGNPFRVLMGLVGESLDAGLRDQEIIRTISSKGIFDEKLVEYAVGVVKDYQKKKKKKAHASAMTNERLAAAKKDEEYASVYDVPANVKTRSTADLIFSLQFIHSGKYNPNFDIKTAEKKVLDQEGKIIVSELEARGFSQEYIKQLKGNYDEDWS